MKSFAVSGRAITISRTPPRTKSMIPISLSPLRSALTEARALGRTQHIGVSFALEAAVASGNQHAFVVSSFYVRMLRFSMLAIVLLMPASVLAQDAGVERDPELEAFRRMVDSDPFTQDETD